MYVPELIRQCLQRKYSYRHLRFKKVYWLLLLLLILLPVRYGLERLNPFGYNGTISPKSVIYAKQLDGLVPDKQAVIFGDPFYIETMFYSSHTVYKDLPSNEDIEYLNKKGYHVYVIVNGLLSNGLKANKNINLLPSNIH